MLSPPPSSVYQKVVKSVADIQCQQDSDLSSCDNGENNKKETRTTSPADDITTTLPVEDITTAFPVDNNNKGGEGACETLYKEQLNSKKLLMVMAYGITVGNCKNIGDTKVEPYSRVEL